MNNSRSNIVVQSVTIARGEERKQCMLRWWNDFLGPRTEYTLELERGPDEVLVGTGPDMFDALIEIRRQLENDGWLIAVQGSRLNAYPSGMARDMGGGERIYVMYPGRAARLEDLVDTLAEADPATLASVDDQKRYVEEWRQSGSAE